MSRDDAHIIDITTFARRILAYTDGLSFDAFASDDFAQSAVLYQFAILGEAVRRLSDDFRGAHPELPWGDIVGMRNIILHRYDRVNLERVWTAIEVAVPRLLEEIEPLVKGDPNASAS